jgi:DNA-binding NarL/FixJ family response regulator
MKNRQSGFFVLNAREMHMPGLLQQGLSYEANSPQSCTSPGTVKEYVYLILKKTSSYHKTVVTNHWHEWMKDGETYRKNNHTS